MKRSRIVAAAATVLLGAGVFVATTTANAATVEYQAENASISKGVVESNHAGFTGTGFVNYDNALGGYVEWTVPAVNGSSGTALVFRYANGTATNRSLQISVNGVIVANNVAFPGTGAWTTWKEVTVTAPLNGGDNKIRATAMTTDGGPNMDRLSADATGQPPTTPPTTTPPTTPPSGDTPVGTNGQLHVCGVHLC